MRMRIGMGKSAPSCFKILACGSRSVDHDDVQAADSKGSTDRRGWSFRKRSARHRVLTDQFGQEVPQPVNNENHEVKSVSCQAEAGVDVTEKTPVVQPIEEKNVTSTEQESKMSNILDEVEDNSEEVCTFDEASVVIIQAFIRRFLARRLFLKEKNVTKLQAAVRGHLVRKQAVGALCCVQAIIRIQARVRARLLIDGSNDSAKKATKEVEPNCKCTYVSIDKLLTNAFANKLMESTPRTKRIIIKCEPKSDSWKWLEIWTSASTVSEEHQGSGSATIEKSAERPDDSDAIDDGVATPGSLSETTEIIPEFAGSAEGSEDESNAIVYDADGFNLKPLKHVAPLLHHSGPFIAESVPMETKGTDLNDIEAAESPAEEESGSEGIKTEPKICSAEEPNTEVEEFSGNASNPAFIAKESKYEDLTSDATLLKLTSFSSCDQYSPPDHDQSKSRDKVLIDGVTSSASAIGICGSECGTELSISSTLDSDGSEFGVIEIRPETGVPYEINHVTSEKAAELHPSYPEAKELQESITPITDSLLNENTSAEIENQKPSPENSPRSQMSQTNIPESQATPSSQVSAANEVEKAESPSKVGVMINEKTPHSTLIQDSSSRNSMEHSQEHKSRMSRNSSGSAKHDHKDQDLRDTTSSSNSLPGYMQATESAKAKLIANGSPRSSPDAQEKGTFIKKRRSLPGSNERQESPRIQRTLPLTQQNAAGNSTKSPQDRKWRR